MNRLTTSWGGYDLACYPEDPRNLLRAWDAADEYLLRHLAEGTGERGPVDLTGSVVVLGDRWGALTTVLADHRPVQITDSFLTQQATRGNLDRNAAAPSGEQHRDQQHHEQQHSVRLLSARDTPPDRIDVLLVRVSKSLAFLEDQLQRLAPAVHAGTVVVGTGMVTEIHNSTLALFERILGPTRTSLAVRKARLIFCTPDEARAAAPDSGRWPLRYALPDDLGPPLAGVRVTNHAGIFCADRLDIGTRFLLRHLPERSGQDRVVDLGCGNGVVGTAVALANPAAQLTFVDESFSAVAAARATFQDNLGGHAKAEFLVADGLTGAVPGSADLVLNNPPFHAHQATTDAIAWRMFTGARDALRPGGELWVIGNRHLGYHVKLRRLFGNSHTVAADSKFVVLRAVRR